jgi:hypothetical protein
MLSRRGFLGSIIGLAAGQSFLAKLITEPYQRIIIPEYRMAFADSLSGFIIQAPGVQEIVRDDNAIDRLHSPGIISYAIKNSPGYRFIAEDLHVYQTMSLDKAIILDKNNKIIYENKFTSRVSLMNGDTIKVQASLNVEGCPLPSLEETVEIFRNKWEKERTLHI